MYQSKLQETNSRIPEKINVNNKFSRYLENAKLKTDSTENTIDTTTENIGNTNSELSTNELLSSLLTYSSGLNSTSSLLSNSSSENSIFPTMTSPLQTLQQAALLKSLKQNSDN
jgi:hypothetical protein